MYSTKVPISLFEQQKLTSLNIIIASFLRVAAPCVFSVCLYVSHVGTDKISVS
jgi:hypothetical protein